MRNISAEVVEGGNLNSTLPGCVFLKVKYMCPFWGFTVIK